MSDVASDLHAVWEVYCAKCGLVGSAHDDDAANIWGKDHQAAHDYEATTYDAATRHIHEDLEILERAYQVDCKTCGLVKDNIVSEEEAHVVGKNHLYAHECQIAPRLESSDEHDSVAGHEKTGEADTPVTSHQHMETFETDETLGSERAAKYFADQDAQEEIEQRNRDSEQAAAQEEGDSDDAG